MTLADAAKILADAGIGDSERDARLLAEHFLGLTPAALLLCRGELPVNEDFEKALRRRSEREPLQYILGVWYFCDEEYFVSPDCLIPRPETEELVLEAEKRLGGGDLLDLCTGSGCIPISVLSRKKTAKAVAVELSEGALAMAERNAAHNGVADRITFARGDVTDPTLPGRIGGKFKVITSNPPYIPSKVVDGLAPELAFEPRMALDGGEDGLVFYRAILGLWSGLLADDGCFLFEIGYDQGGSLLKLASEKGFEAEILKDLWKNDRIAVVRAQ